MYTKEIVTVENFLNKVKGFKVSDLVEYLQTLNQDAYFSVYVDGEDTHGCEVSANIIETVPLTEKEILQCKIEKVREKIAIYEQSVKYYTLRAQYDRIEQLGLNEKLAKCKLELEELLK